MHAEDHFDDDFLMRLLPDPANTLVFPWKRSAGFCQRGTRLFEFGYPVTRYEAEIYPLAMALR